MSGFRIKESFTVKGGEGQSGRMGDKEFGMGIGGGVRIRAEGEGGDLGLKEIGEGEHDMQEGSYGTGSAQRSEWLLWKGGWICGENMRT